MWKPNQIPRGEGDGGGGGGPPPAWYGAETNKPVVEAKGFKGVDDVINWGTNLEKLLGADKAGRTVVLPKDDKDADGIKAFRAKLGVPEKVDGYKTPDTLKDDPLWGAAAGLALKHGIPASAFDGFIADLLTEAGTHSTKADAAAKEASDKELETLKGEWGDKFDANAEVGRRFMKALGINDEQMKAVESALGTATFLKMFHAGGAKLGEAGGAGGGADGGGAGSATQEAAQAKINQARTDRLAGKLTDVAFQEIVNKYGPIAFPEPKVAA